MHMSTPVYTALTNSSVSWQCVTCGMPQFSSSLFENSSQGVNLSNSFDSLGSLSSVHDSAARFNPGPPLASSTPSRQSNIKSEKKQNRTDRRMKIVVVNFQSAKNKKEEIGNMIDSCNPDVIIGTETWLNENIHSTELFPPSYTVIRKDRSDGYGGVLIALKQEFTFEHLTSKRDCESVFIKLPLQRRKALIIGAVYRPPSSSQQYLDSLCSEVEDIHRKHRNAIFWIGGDLNLPDIDWSTMSTQGYRQPQAFNNRFLEMVDACGFQQMVNFPTRLNSILDLFLSNRPSLVSSTNALPGISDHDIVLITTDIMPRRKKPIRRKIYLWKHANLTDMKQECLAFRKEFDEKSSRPVTEMWDDVKQFLTQLQDKHVPSKMSSTRFHQPWITTSVKRLSQQKKRSFNRAKKTQSAEDFLKYQHLKKKTRSACKQAYNNYVTNIVSPESSSNPKRFWGFINSRRCDSSGVSPLKSSDGVVYSDSHSKARILNQQFASVFTKDGNEHNIKNLGTPHPPMEKIKVAPAGVYKLLNGLDIHKSTGPDKISSKLLKTLALELTPVFTLLYQTSLDQGEVPDDWRTADVTPIFKKGEKCKPENYRPISLTSVPCKLLEHIVCSAVMDHLDENNILTDAQHGFRKRRSCDSQLILAIQDLAKGIEDRKQHDVILLDFSKAFDKVPHTRLIHKLHHYGIQDTTLQWISDFLSNRTQQVVLEGSRSEKARVTSGVPQGSVIGPLLFLLYINDLPEYVSPGSTVRLFADDCMLYRRVDNDQDSSDLQEDLNRLQQWESDWLMSFNPRKCQVIHVTTKRRPVTRTYLVHNQPLESVDSAKYLGVTIKSDLNWSPHILSITKKAKAASAFLQRNIQSCPRKTKSLCYQALVRPIVEYASSIWDPHSEADTNRLEMVQRRFARFAVKDFRRDSSVSEMLDKLQWPTLAERRASRKVFTIHRILHNEMDLPQHHHYLVPSPRLHRGNSRQFQIPFARTAVYQKSFFPDSIRLWNALPDEIVNIDSPTLFKKEVESIRLR